MWLCKFLVAFSLLVVSSFSPRLPFPFPLVLCRMNPHLLPSILGEKREQQFVFYSTIAIAKLSAAVGDAHMPPLLAGGRGHIRVVSVGDAGEVTAFP